VFWDFPQRELSTADKQANVRFDTLHRMSWLISIVDFPSVGELSEDRVSRKHCSGGFFLALAKRAHAVTPPLTIIDNPVTYEAASLHSHSAACAASSEVSWTDAGHSLNCAIF
jgi:hypothetical protein